MPAVRSVFISDVHLGTRACQAAQLTDFLREHPSDYLYLVGDIVDFWAMSRSIQWAPAHNTVVQKILRRARHGGHVMFIPGNHDEVLREYVGISFGNIRVEQEWIHEAADGRRYLLIHGDEFDQITRFHRWLALLGDIGYGFLLRLNAGLSKLRRMLGVSGYWSLAGYAKRRVKKAVNFISDFEASVAHSVRQRGLDGVICGHIHWAEIRELEGVSYLNCGDWVDSCTAIVEDFDGRFAIVTWRGAGGGRGKADAAAPAAPPDGSAAAAGRGTTCAY